MGAGIKILTEILREIRELNCKLELAGQERGVTRFFEQLGEYQQDCQSLLEVAKRQSRDHENILRDIRAQYTKLSVLLDPKLTGAYRNNNVPTSWQGVSGSLRSEGKTFGQWTAQLTNGDELGNTGVVLRNGLLDNLGSQTVQQLDEGITSTPASAQQMRVVSTSANDTASGTGVRSLRLYYVNSASRLATEDITLNGTTPVNTVTTAVLQVNLIRAITVGSGGFAAGAISLQNTAGSTTYAQIAAGQNSWRSARYYVPSGTLAYLYEWDVSAYNGGAKFELDASLDTGFSGPLIERAVLFASDAMLAQNFPIPIRIDGPALMTVRAIARGGTSCDVASDYMLIQLNSDTNLP